MVVCFKNLIKNLKVPLTDGHYAPVLEDNFHMNSFKLIYPADLNKLATMKRCVVIASTKQNPSVQVALKLELSSGVRSGYSTRRNSIKCGRADLKNQEIPTEHRINTLMQGQKYFLPYFEKYSGIIKTENGSSLDLYMQTKFEIFLSPN